LQEAGQAVQRRVQADVVVDLLDLRFGLAERRPQFTVFVVSVGDDGVEAIVAARKLDDDQHRVPGSTPAGRVGGGGCPA
jgi:acyl transferase domain-containing protein